MAIVLLVHLAQPKDKRPASSNRSRRPRKRASFVRQTSTVVPYGRLGVFPHRLHRPGPGFASPQCSQNNLVPAGSVRHRALGCAFKHQANSSRGVMGPPQSRQNREPALTGAVVAIVPYFAWLNSASVSGNLFPVQSISHGSICGWPFIVNVP